MCFHSSFPVILNRTEQSRTDTIIASVLPTMFIRFVFPTEKNFCLLCFACAERETEKREPLDCVSSSFLAAVGEVTVRGRKRTGRDGQSRREIKKKRRGQTTQVYRTLLSLMQRAVFESPLDDSFRLASPLSHRPLFPLAKQ